MTISVHGCGALLLAACLFFSACTPTDVVTDVQIGLDVISAGIPLLQGVGVPADVTNQAAEYASLANAGLGQVSAILAGIGSPGEKAAASLAALAGITAQAPKIPAQYAAIANLINAISTQVAKVIAGLPPPAVTTKMGVRAAPKLDRGTVNRLSNATLLAAANSARLLLIVHK